jgi:3-deoxy-D-manno-octulosonic-acid transferase
MRLKKPWISDMSKGKNCELMNPWYAAYAAIGSVAFIPSAPFLWLYSRLNRRFAKGWKQRLGFLPYGLSAIEAPIWFHASSLGELRVADSIMSRVRKLRPESPMILSVNTDYGFESARTQDQDTLVVYAPFDVLFSVRKALSIAEPRLMVFLETEIWPAWIVEARRKGIHCALVNGRISSGSFRRYRKAAPLFREVLRCVDAFSMISETDRSRILAMGADPGKVEVHGNAKHDLLVRQANPSVAAEMRRLLDLRASDTVFVAGSTREGEEEKVIEVFSRVRKEFPETILVIAPRHIARRPSIENMLRRRNLVYQLRSRLRERGGRRTAPVLILDTFGELFKVYSVGTINFCGASLVPKGGQNPMEAAVWGKAVFYGPFMDDFMEARALLERVGGGILVKDAVDFSEKAIALLRQRDSLAFLGKQARSAVLESRNAAERHAAVIARMLKKTEVPE